MELDEVKLKFEHLNKNYQSWLYYYQLFRQLKNTVIKDYWEELADRNVKVRNDFWWILWENTEISFFNLAIIQIASLFSKWKDEYSVSRFLNDLIKSEHINKIEKKRLDWFVKFLKSNDFQKYRGNLAHSFFERKNIHYNITYNKIDENILGLWELLNELNVKFFDRAFSYEWYKEWISSDYKRIMEDLYFSNNIKEIFWKNKYRKDFSEKDFMDKCKELYYETYWD